MSSAMASSILVFGRKSTTYSAPSIELGMAALSAESLYLGHGDSLNPDVRDGLADIVELERFDDCGDEFHFAVSGQQAVNC